MRREFVGLLTAGLLTLAGCGGGGGGGGTALPSGGGGGAALPTADNIKVANNDGIRQGAGETAISLPKFGSVTQSSNSDGASITTDAADATFDGTGLDVRIERQGSGPIVLDTANPLVVSSDPITGVTGRSTRTWGIASLTGDSLTVARLAVDWASDDPSDYLAGGYWLHLEGDLQSSDLVAEIGAFVDGPELSLSNPPSMPLQGSATYEGAAAGFFGIVHGSDTSDPPGSIAIGEFSGLATLTADFEASTIRGCVGCNGGVSAEYLFVDGATRNVENVSVSSEPYRLRLGETSFASNGTFRGSDVRLSIPDLQIAESSGAWGGQFSNIPDAAGDPRLVAGTFGAEATTSGGTTGQLIGAFGAGKR